MSYQNLPEILEIIGEDITGLMSSFLVLARGEHLVTGEVDETSIQYGHESLDDDCRLTSRVSEYKRGKSKHANDEGFHRAG